MLCIPLTDFKKVIHLTMFQFCIVNMGFEVHVCQSGLWLGPGDGERSGGGGGGGLGPDV